MKTDRALRWVLFLASAGLIAYLCASIVRPFANVIAWSSVLAIVCHPVHRRLVRRTHRASLSAFITSVLTVVVVVVPILAIGAIALNECASLGRALRPNGTPAAWLGAHLGLDESAITAWIEQHDGDLVRTAGRFTVSIASGALDAAISSLLVVLTMFLLLRDGQGIVDRIIGLLPFDRQRAETLLQRVTDVTQASVYGVVVIAVAQGALCGAMLRLLGVPAAALWGTVTTFASLLPVVGAFAVWGPAAAYLALAGHVTKAIVLAIWGAFVVSGIDNVLRPRLVAGRVGLGELPMLFAMLGGVTVFGGLGIVLGPVAFATAAAIVDTLDEPPEPQESRG